MIYVKKRDGSTEPLDLNKFHRVCEHACAGLAGVSISSIELRSQIQFFDGITTKQIHETLVKAAADLIGRFPAIHELLAMDDLLLLGDRSGARRGGRVVLVVPGEARRDGIEHEDRRPDPTGTQLERLVVGGDAEPVGARVDERARDRDRTVTVGVCLDDRGAGGSDRIKHRLVARERPHEAGERCVVTTGL